MKKKILIIGLCTVLISMPSILAFSKTNNSSLLFIPSEKADGTFVGGLGRGHWRNGFHIDTVNAYVSGEYTSDVYTKISGDITNPNNMKIGEITVYIIYKFLFGFTKNSQGLKAPIISYLVENRDNQFAGQILFSSFKTSPHIWGYLIPNK
jgi:hypothetical protein